MIRSQRIRLFVATVGLVALFATTNSADAMSPQIDDTTKTILKEFCFDCHAGEQAASKFNLESTVTASFADSTKAWEAVVRKLRTRQMPPLDSDRPSEREYNRVVKDLTSALDRIAAQNPRPGRVPMLRRLNRTEYQNAVRDLLAVDIDAAKLLPADESSHGFDNITVDELSPTLFSRYITAAQVVSRMAVGGIGRGANTHVYRMQADITQEEHVPGLPIGTRGGLLIKHAFPQTGEYTVHVRLARDRNEEVEGLRREHKLEILLDRQRIKLLSIRPPKNKDYSTVDANLSATLQAKAGVHAVGVTFLKDPSSLIETKRQPYDAHFNMHRHPRQSPAVFQVTINGPFDAKGPGATVSRKRIFVREPSSSHSANETDDCAEEILSHVARRAYRRPVSDDDLVKPMRFFREEYKTSNNFDAGIERALTSILINPNFLFRVEARDENQSTNDPAIERISDLQLASRLSFFLWSSIPDDELLAAAVDGKLNEPAELARQVRRMLSDNRSQSLVTNFAAQWLYLRNLDSITPDLRLFPDFDDNLRQAFRRETELHFERILREDRSVLDLLKSDDTFLNERLARHYRIPHIYGSRFREVRLPSGSHRGGLLRQGSLLTVTSYATRTSPVLRGNWVLENLLGSPAPPPPDDVPALKDNTVNNNQSVRARLAQHRENPACAQCHNLMDPIGFALENYDAVGRWRDVEAGAAVDSRGGFPDGSQFAGVAGLESALLARPELFVHTLVERLMTFALGRGTNHDDQPAIRAIVRDAAKDNYRFSTLIQGIVKSVPFRMRYRK